MYGRSGKDHTVATLSIAYLIVTEIIIESLKSKERFSHAYVIDKDYPLRTEGRAYGTNCGRA